ncbi:MAG: tripartite tricarboxylate transporter substrate binding protein [Burkholderiaceae bacterium]
MDRYSISRSRGGARRRMLGQALGAAMAFAAAGLGAGAAAQSYPSQPVRIIVPFQAGGLTDIVAREIGSRLGERLGTAVVVENRPGAGGNIGADLVAKAPPDGHTLLMGSIGTNAVNALIYRKMPYDSATAFAPISLVASGTLMLVVNPAVPAKDLKQLLSLARAEPGRLSYASGGNGASQHLAGELLKTMAGVDIVHVPYKGIAHGVTDLVAGQVSMTFDMATVLPYVKSGKLRPIAVANGQRSSSLPDVPTIAEAGLPGYEASAWYGLFAPAGTPAEIVRRLNSEVVGILKRPEVREKFISLGAEPVGNSSEAFAAFIAAEVDKWRPIVKQAKMQMD